MYKVYRISPETNISITPFDPFSLNLSSPPITSIRLFGGGVLSQDGFDEAQLGTKSIIQNKIAIIFFFHLTNRLRLY